MMHKRNLAWLIMPGFCVLLALSIVIVHKTKLASQPVAAAGIVSCDGDKTSDFNCWQQRYQAMTQDDSAEAAFADIKMQYEVNPYVKANCHQLGHVIGRTAALKYSSLTETYKHGDQFCWSGYYHGAIESVAKRIGKDQIVKQMTSVCQDFFKTKPYGFDHYNCVHGMGHGLMSLQDGELFTALKTCDGYQDDWERQSCYSGVFMENVMNEINPGKHSNYLKQDEPLYPCTAVGNQYKEQCYLMQTSHALLTVNYDYDKVFQLCSTVAAPYDVTCYQSLGRDVSGQASSDQATTIERCDRGPSRSAIENCYTGAVKDFISYFHSDKQGLALCSAIQDDYQSASCQQVATSYYRTL